MLVNLMSGPRELHAIQKLAQDAERAGFGGITFTEGGRTAYLSVAAAALATEQLEFSTGIAVAFPRSPMITAGIAWELQDASRGRFRLGIGTQVRAHITRRYGVEFDPPGPRMRDYVAALRAIFLAFQGKQPLDHHGPYYELTLLNPMWSPGAIEYAAPAIDVAAVGPYMLKMAGELCDGIHVHPLHSMKYLTDVVAPTVAEGARRGNRDPSEVDLLVPVLTIVGDSEEEKAGARAFCRQQVAFYGSTPNYALQFDLLGFEGTTARLRERQKAGDMAGMVEVISDEMLEHYTVDAKWDDLADRLVDRYRGHASQLIMYTAGMDYARDPSSIDRWGEVAKAVANVA
ncbi:MAG: TIGR03617 family F420-dependent LLM class oxidoreductase [Deltaproteobacteria bacterium]|nr:TIGR03617 family F420-dependent LLM class oxidoreductase [Deltaproteobacteria bacterium]